MCFEFGTQWLRFIASLMLLCFVVCLSGCGSYAIEGRVVRGPAAAIQLVDADDPRLLESNPTGGGAVVQAILEPDTPTEVQDLGRHVTNGQGWFAIPVNAFGSSVLEYEARLIARREGHQGVMRTIPLPRGRQRVLITLPLGRDTLVVPEKYLDRTLRDAKPYLEENR